MEEAITRLSVPRRSLTSQNLPVSLKLSRFWDDFSWGDRSNSRVGEKEPGGQPSFATGRVVPLVPSPLHVSFPLLSIGYSRQSKHKKKIAGSCNRWEEGR